MSDNPFVLPTYSQPGRILIEILGMYEGTFRWDFEVYDYDSDSCVFWINEGIGFDYWLDRHCNFPCLGYHVIEGIVGYYHRGTWGFDDDDEFWNSPRYDQQQ